MTVQLHKITIWAVSTQTDAPDEESLARLQGDCYHNGCKIAEIETVEFDREWSDDDPLNMTSNLENREFLEGLIAEGKQ